jgi:hypothetical protein
MSITGHLTVNRGGFGNFAHCPSGRHSDPLGKYLTPGLTKGNNPEPAFPSHKDGAYFVLNHQWECVFQPGYGVESFWHENLGMLKYMGYVVRDIIAIPGVSVTIEHLFLSLRHTLSDTRSSMTAETASMDIVTKEWLKLGLAEGMN